MVFQHTIKLADYQNWRGLRLPNHPLLFQLLLDKGPEVLRFGIVFEDGSSD